MTGQTRAYSRAVANVSRLIAEAIDRAGESTASPAPQMEALRALKDRIAASRLHVAMLGQFKRGKSSLLNALLGKTLLPIGVVPLTAIATFVTAGAGPALRTTFLNGECEERVIPDLAALHEALAQLVTEQGNPGNRLGLARVECRLKTPLLGRGVVLLDTPGVGSTLRHNTRTAEAGLAECDAALFVVSPDPPITEAELAYLARIRNSVARLSVVLNKIDTVSAEDLETSIRFLRGVLVQQAGLAPDLPIVPVSARMALDSKLAGDDDALRASGLPDLEAHLADLLGGKAERVLVTAVARKAAHAVVELRMAAEIAARALQMPLADLEDRIGRFNATLTGIHDEQRSASARIEGEQTALLAQIEREAADLGRSATAELLRDFDDMMRREEDLSIARRRLAERVPLLFGPAMEEIGRSVEAELGAVFARTQERTDALIDRIREAAAMVMDMPPPVPLSREAPQVERRPAWITDGRIETLSGITGEAASHLLPATIRRVQARRRLLGEIETLTRRNVESLRWSLRRHVEDSLRRFASALEQRLSASLSAVRGAMEAARAQHQGQSATIEQQVEKQKRVSRRLVDIERELGEAGAVASDARTYVASAERRNNARDDNPGEARPCRRDRSAEIPRANEFAPDRIRTSAGGAHGRLHPPDRTTGADL